MWASPDCSLPSGLLLPREGSWCHMGGQSVACCGSRLRPQLWVCAGSDFSLGTQGGRGLPLGMASVWISRARECIGDGWREPEAVLEEEGGGRRQIGTLSAISTKKAEACPHRRAGLPWSSCGRSTPVHLPLLTDLLTPTFLSPSRVFAPKCASCARPILPAQVGTLHWEAAAEAWS